MPRPFNNPVKTIVLRFEIYFLYYITCNCCILLLDVIILCGRVS